MKFLGVFFSPPLLMSIDYGITCHNMSACSVVGLSRFWGSSKEDWRTPAVKVESQEDLTLN